MLCLNPRLKPLLTNSSDEMSWLSTHMPVILLNFLSVFKTMLRKSNMDELLLPNGSYTLIAPTNRALAQVEQRQLEQILNDKGRLRKVGLNRFFLVSPGIQDPSHHELLSKIFDSPGIQDSSHHELLWKVFDSPGIQDPIHHELLSNICDELPWNFSCSLTFSITWSSYVWLIHRQSEFCKEGFFLYNIWTCQ